MKRDARIGLSVVLVLGTGWFPVQWAGNSEREKIEALVSALAPTYAHELEYAGHWRITTETPPEDPTYQHILDLERDWGLSEGNIFQGELTLEQLFFLRPAPGWAQYNTPVNSLYMCGSATHPGGGIMGAPGRNAAMKILADTRR